MSEQDLEARELDNEDDNTSENEDSVDFDTLLIQKKKMREQRDKARKALEEAESKLKEKDELLSKSKEETSAEGQKVTQKLELIEFTIAHRDLSAEDITELQDIAKGKWLDLAKAYESSIFQSYLKSKETIDLPGWNRGPKGSQSQQSEVPTDDKEHREYLRKLGIN